MRKSYTRLFCLCLSSSLLSCASLKTRYELPEGQSVCQPAPQKELDFRFYLLGDAGQQPAEGLSPTLQLLSKQLADAPKNSAVVFLGNHLYPKGLPKKSSSRRQQAEKLLQKQLDLFDDYPGLVYFIPGNRDWGSDGVDGLRRMEEYIQDYLGQDEDPFIPDDACSGPETEDLTEITSLLAIDSQWWLQDWDEEPELNQDCEYRTKEVFMLEMDDEFKDHRNKVMLVAMHHPLRSNGRYGGNYSLDNHLFPFRLINSKLYLPLPGLGSLGVFLNGIVASRQELAHPDYRELEARMTSTARTFGTFIFASAHDHSLQYFTDDKQHFIVSGSASKRGPVGMDRGAIFASGQMGYSVVNVYKDGEVWLEFWGADGANGRLLFRQPIKPPLPEEAEQIPDSFPQYERLGDTLEQSVMERSDIKVYNSFFWGDLRTDLYFMDVRLPVLDLTSELGGMTAFKRGGGFQTNSLRLKDTLGRVFQIRSLEKHPRKMPYPLNKTFARKIYKHQLTAGHPYGAFLLTPMADAIGIYHTNPRLFFVPKQPQLGKFNDYGGEVFLFEERPDGDWRDLASFGHSKDIISTWDVLEERLESDKAEIDQALFLRSRLFDQIIGDWDRHYDQWRWAAIEQEGSERTLYRPIPRDRDQAFAHYDGFVQVLVKQTIPFLRAQRKFDADVKPNELRWLNFQPRHLDRLFLNELTWEDWEREVQHIQTHLTDSIIEAGVHWLPDTVFQHTGPNIIRWTKSRRDALMKTARRYFQILNRRVSLPATFKDNLIVVERLDADRTQVSIYEYRDEKKAKDLVYERIFEHKKMKELALYGLEGDDEFRVMGKVKAGLRLRLIGGIGEDDFQDDSQVNGPGKKTKIYDAKLEKSRLQLGREAVDRRAHRFELNDYVFQEFQYNYLIPVPQFGANPDDGIWIGLKPQYHTFGFKKKQIHSFATKYALTTRSWQLAYQGDYRHALGQWDLALSLTSEGPKYVRNFFGLGNESPPMSRDIDYYRVRRERISVHPALKKRFDGGAFFSVGPVAEMVKIEARPERIVGDAQQGIKPEVFNWQYFVGAQAQFAFLNVDDAFIPTRGVDLDASLSWRANWQDWTDNFTTFHANMSLYFPLIAYGRLVWASRVGASYRLGEYDFFQASTLGGPNKLRGFRQDRFTGRTAFFHSNDLRLKLFYSENKVIPFSMGIAPGVDYGRVWQPGEQSDKWHFSYGGNIWIAPLDYIAFSASLFFSEDGQRFSMRTGFQF